MQPNIDFVNVKIDFIHSAPASPDRVGPGAWPSSTSCRRSVTHAGAASGSTAPSILLFDHRELGRPAQHLCSVAVPSGPPIAITAVDPTEPVRSPVVPQAIGQPAAGPWRRFRAEI